MTSQMPLPLRKGVTMSAVKPITKHFISEILLDDDSDSADIKAMKEAIKDDWR